MRKIIYIILLLLVTSALLGFENPKADIYNLRAYGMGGARLAFADDQYAIINNPAAPAMLKKKYISIMQAQAVISAGDFWDIWDSQDDFLKLKNGSGSVDNDTWNLISRLKINVGTTPLYLAFINVGIPFINWAIYNTTTAKIKANPDIPLPSWDFQAYNDTVLLGNVAFPLVDYKFGSICIGANFKLIHRLQYTQEKLDVFKIYDLTQLEVDDLDVYKALGFGADIGVIMDFNKWLIISATVTDIWPTKFRWTKLNNPSDIFGNGISAGSTRIDPALNLGFQFKVGTIIPLLFEKLKFGLDIKDITNNKGSFFLKVYAGAEFEMLKGFFKIRVGLYQGWITAGLTIDIPLPFLAEIVFAYWGEELGEYPGQERIDNLGLGINFFF